MAMSQRTKARLEIFFYGILVGAAVTIGVLVASGQLEVHLLH